MSTRAAATAWLLLAAGAVPGCQIVAFPFFIAREAYKQGSHIEPAQYEGLRGKSFGVLISADRGVHSGFPGVIAQLTGQISQRLHNESEASGWVPPVDMLRYQYENPSWPSKPFGEVASELGVERLIVVDLQEFRLNDPGNRYLYDGVAAATVAVVEADGPSPDDVAHEFFVSVAYPDAGGFGPDDLAANQVISVLVKRFTDRASWPFYDAKIPNDLAY